MKELILSAKHFLAERLPPSIVESVHQFRNRRSLQEAKRKFTSAQAYSDKLTLNELRRLCSKYDFKPNYEYDLQALDIRGKERSSFLKSRIPSFENQIKFLEVGCFDGMVCGHLAGMGKETVGVDVTDKGFSSEAINLGAELRVLDASILDFEDNSFDVCFSYDAFEHFASPDLVLKEMVRVTKPNGYFYFEFGPLWFSPMGMHIYKSIPVPYTPLLFDIETIQAYLREEGLKPYNLEHCNGWSLTQFRNLWNSFSNQLEIIDYKEVQNLNHMDVVSEHSAILKSQTQTFDDLTCAEVRLLAKKIG